MKKLFVIIGAAFVLLSCNKEAGVKPQPSSSAISDNAARKAAKADDRELQTLIRAWSEWVYSRPFSVAPFTDTDGSLQYLNQPFSEGVFMLAGGSSPELVKRTVTISLDDYQFVFVPLVVITVLDGLCDPSFGPHGGQNPKAFFQSLIKKAFNGPRELTLDWDGNSLLSTKKKDTRANSGVWEFYAHPDYTGCTEGLTSAYADGFFAKIPLTLGTHTLTVGGNLDFRGTSEEFSNMVEYTIIVTP
jgi:hypothetical protein